MVSLFILSLPALECRYRGSKESNHHKLKNALQTLARLARASQHVQLVLYHRLYCVSGRS
jgi:hypothetical protein